MSQIILTIDDDVFMSDGDKSPQFLLESVKANPKFFVMAADEVKIITRYGQLTENREVTTWNS